MSLGLRPRPRYCLVSDDDGHRYVVPAERTEEFSKIIEAIGDYWEQPGVLLDDSEPPKIPEWAHCVGGSPTLVTFEKPEIDGKEIL